MDSTVWFDQNLGFLRLLVDIVNWLENLSIWLLLGLVLHLLLAYWVGTCKLIINLTGMMPVVYCGI